MEKKKKKKKKKKLPRKDSIHLQSYKNGYTLLTLVLFLFFISHILIHFCTGAIPVGIAVARQRLQEHAQQQHQHHHQHQTKDINRYSNIGIATDLGKLLFF